MADFCPPIFSMKFKVDERLQAIASFVRQDAVLADVGSDHAFLPIYLVLENKIRSAVASDIHEGPIQRATQNIASRRLSQQIAVVKTDGLMGLENFAPTDIVIAGMGGELIAEIINQAPFAKSEKLHFILQPMTKSEKLRKYLWKNGFYIEKEKIVSDASKIYQILSVYYDGEKRSYPEWYAYAGQPPLLQDQPLYRICLAHLLQVFDQQLNGLYYATRTSKMLKEKQRIQTLKFEIEEWLKS